MGSRRRLQQTVRLALHSRYPSRAVNYSQVHGFRGRFWLYQKKSHVREYPFLLIGDQRKCRRNTPINAPCTHSTNTACEINTKRTPHLQSKRYKNEPHLCVGNDMIHATTERVEAEKTARPASTRHIECHKMDGAALAILLGHELPAEMPGPCVSPRLLQ